MENENNRPYIKPEIKLPEITPKALLLGVLLSMVLAGANAYLGLFAGMTVSASIPAAVISMAILRLFRNHNILENNAVQTAASAGESLAAGAIFTFPALVLMGAWEDFDFWETFLIALCGGVLGVLFTIPLRSALVVKQKLKFPEGVATAEVLKSGEEGGKSIRFLAIAGLIGALTKLCGAGFHLWQETFARAALIGKKGYAFFGLNLSPALVAVGYIVGLNIAILVFAGGVISWWIAIPTLVALEGVPEMGSAVDYGYDLWSNRIRYLGVGAMVVGGVWALVSLRSSLGFAVGQAVKAFREKGPQSTLRTERDTPLNWVLLMVIAMIIPIFIIYLREVAQVEISALMAVLMVIAGFLFSAVAGYMAGLVGSSNNPISGVTIATILTASLILLALMGTESGNGAAAAILIGAVVCCAAAIAGDNMQDLKAGYELGATPQKQQIMQMVGVASAAFSIPFVLSLLNAGYGFGAPTPEHPNPLTAPQATLMQSVAEGVFNQNLPWDMVWTGAGIGILIILLDEYLRKRNSTFRTPVLAVAVGLYLPFELDSAIMLGGLLAWAVNRFQHQRKSDVSEFKVAQQSSDRTGLLVASGLITGEALVGILLAVPVAIAKRSDVLALLENPIGDWPGLLVLAAICWYLYRTATKAFATR